MFSASPFSQSRRNRDDSDHGKRESAPNLTESQGVSESVSGSLNPVRGTDHHTPNPAAMLRRLQEMASGYSLEKKILKALLKHKQTLCIRHGYFFSRTIISVMSTLFLHTLQESKEKIIKN